MRLAEALLERKELKIKLSNLRSRADGNLVVQEGNDPVEEPNQLIRQMEIISRALTTLIMKINKVNATATLPNGMTLGDALVQRDEWQSQTGRFRGLAQTARNGQVERYSQKEIRNICLVDVTELEKKADDYARKARELDAAIQAANWEIEIE